MTAEISTQDITYLRHGDRAFTARAYRPAGAGPFPAVLDVHGGAWTGGDLSDGEARDRAVAEAGILAVAIDFRHGADGYPSSLQDINHAIGWLKSQAGEFGVDAKRIGLTGNSSGGHLAMLAAMRPNDPRYLSGGSANPDASVRCVAMLWPVINPLSRYHYARRLRDSATPPEWVATIPERHELYWKTEAAMAEGNPMLALERGEKIQLPPAIWIQGRPGDAQHDYRDPESGFDGPEPDRFVANYRKAGGAIELAVIDHANRAAACIDPLLAFFRKHLAR